MGRTAGPPIIAPFEHLIYPRLGGVHLWTLDFQLSDGSSVFMSEFTNGFWLGNSLRFCLFIFAGEVSLVMFHRVCTAYIRASDA